MFPSDACNTDVSIACFISSPRAPKIFSVLPNVEQKFLNDLLSLM
jgi:hypothetical protein